MRGPVTVYTNAENAICVYSLGGNTRSIQLDLVLCNISFGHLSAEYFMNAADQTILHAYFVIIIRLPRMPYFVQFFKHHFSG